MIFLLSQVPNATPTQIGDWLVGFAAVLAIAALAKGLLVRRPSIDAEFVTKAEHQKDMDTIKKDVDSIRGKMDRDSEKILTCMEDNKRELLIDGRRRSAALYEHIKDQNTEVFSRLLNNDKKIAALEERTHG